MHQERERLKKTGQVEDNPAKQASANFKTTGEQKFISFPKPPNKTLPGWIVFGISL